MNPHGEEISMLLLLSTSYQVFDRNPTTGQDN